MKKVRATLPNLLENTSYAIRVRAINGLGVKSDWSDPIVINPGEEVTQGSTYVDPPSGLAISAGIESIAINWLAPPARMRYWEVFITDDVSKVASYSPDLDGSGKPVPRVSGYTFDGVTTSATYAIQSFPSMNSDGEFGNDGVWRSLRPNKLYYVGVRSVGSDGSKSSVTWTQVNTGLLNNAYFQAGAIDADKIRASEITAALTITGGVIQTAVSNLGGYVQLTSSGIYAGATPSSNSSFHVNTLGQVWLGSQLYTTAPLKLNTDGSVHVRGDGILYVGDTTGTAENIRLAQPNNARAQLQFYKGTSFKGAIEYNFQSSHDYIKCGFEDTDFSMQTGLRIVGPAPTTADSEIEFYDNNNVILKLNYLLASNTLEITAPQGILTGTGSQDLKFDTGTNRIIAETSTRAAKYGIIDLTREINIEETLKNLRPVAFNWKESTKRSYGLIAEEVAEISNVLVGKDKDNKPISIQWNDITAMLITAYSDIMTRISNIEEFLNGREIDLNQD